MMRPAILDRTREYFRKQGELTFSAAYSPIRLAFAPADSAGHHKVWTVQGWPWNGSHEAVINHQVGSDIRPVRVEREQVDRYAVAGRIRGNERPANNVTRLSNIPIGQRQTNHEVLQTG